MVPAVPFPMPLSAAHTQLELLTRGAVPNNWGGVRPVGALHPALLA